MSNKKYKCIVISDVHLGSKWSAVREATQFIKDNSCERLYLNGDIIDGWAIQRSAQQRWKRRHTAFMKAVLDASNDTRVIYIRGNHDDFLDRVLPINFMNVEVVRDHIYESFGRRYYVLHGDIFDRVTTSMRWLAQLGDIGYSILLWYNRIYNARRKRHGKPYHSIASEVKLMVKGKVSYVSKYEDNLAQIAHLKGYDGVICGHIHHAEIREIDGIAYLNSGDWIESLTALVETHEGEWQLVQMDRREAEVPREVKPAKR